VFAQCLRDSFQEYVALAVAPASTPVAKPSAKRKVKNVPSKLTD
jgi:hypothetical protein